MSKCPLINARTFPEQFGVFTFGDLPGVSGVVVFNHTHCLGGFDIESTTLITSIFWPNLIDIDPTGATGGFIFFNGNTALTSLHAPLLLRISNPSGVRINIQSNPVLTTIDFPVLLPENGLSHTFHGNALSALSVNSLLARCVANVAFVSGAIDLAGGTNAAPTGQGIVDKATLIGRGVIVTTN